MVRRCKPHGGVCSGRMEIGCVCRLEEGTFLGKVSFHQVPAKSSRQNCQFPWKKLLT